MRDIQRESPWCVLASRWCEYLGMDASGLVDAEPVLRHFGGAKKRAP
jgi:hypothetical protein